jgi:hypothetical protein
MLWEIASVVANLPFDYGRPFADAIGGSSSQTPET